MREPFIAASINSISGLERFESVNGTVLSRSNQVMEDHTLGWHGEEGRNYPRFFPQERAWAPQV